MLTNVSKLLETSRNRTVAVFVKEENLINSFLREATHDSTHWMGNWTALSGTQCLYCNTSNNVIFFNAVQDLQGYVAISYFHADCDPQKVDNALKTLKSKNNLWFTFSRSDGFQVIGPIK
jgi:hypothetical protein